MTKATENIAENSHPALLILGGGSVTGKSVMARRLLGLQKEGTPVAEGSEAEKQAIAKEFQYITPEKVIAALDSKISREIAIRRGSGNRHPEKLPEYIVPYYNTLERMVVENLKSGKSVLLDDHCDNPEYISSLLDTVHRETPDAETGLIGLFVGPETSKRLQKKAGVIYDDEAINNKPAYDFMLKSAHDFSENFETYTGLFDTTLLIENNIRTVAQHISNNGIAEEIYKDDEGYRIFRRDTDYSEKIHEREAAQPQDRSGQLAGRIRRRNSGILQPSTWQKRVLAAFSGNAQEL